MTRPAKFLRDTSGIAATEFALIAPILILLFLGVVEVSNLLVADMKLRATASSVADLMAQDSDGSISAADLNLAGVAAQQIMAPLPITGSRLNLTVTNYQISSAVGNPVTVRWRRFYTPPAAPIVSATPACDGTGLPVTLKAATLNDVLRVDASYVWIPMFFRIYSASITLSTTNFNMPRYALTLPLATGLPNGC